MVVKVEVEVVVVVVGIRKRGRRVSTSTAAVAGLVAAASFAASKLVSLMTSVKLRYLSLMHTSMSQ